MSSHHVIRDNQEFALIIADGAACSMKLMNELLEWQPLVIALDGALRRVHELGIKVDVWLGDFDHVTDMGEIVQAQLPLEVVKTPDQNFTDLEKGIEFCIGRGFKNVYIVWAMGLRADHTFGNIGFLAKYREKIHLTMMDDYSTIVPLPNVFEKWYPKDTRLSLLPVGKAEGIITEGLLYELKNEALDLVERVGISNQTVADGNIKISYSNGHLLLMECRDIDKKSSQ